MTDALPFASRTGGTPFSRYLRSRWLVLLVGFTATFLARAQEMPPLRQWDKTLGGSSNEYPHALVNTPDGGYLLGGYSGSDQSGDKTENSRGDFDYWVVKIDRNGNKQWDKTFGGSGRDMLEAIVGAADGGYLLAGSSDSPAGADKSENSRGDSDYWIIKIDSSGTKVWDKTVGGSSEDYLNDLIATPDEGYLLGGSSYSDKGGDKSENGRGERDYWVVKLDGQGNVGWDKTLGSGGSDRLSALIAAGDGGYLVGGSSSGPAGGEKSEDGCAFDYWLVKLDGEGHKRWDRTFAENCTPDFLGDLAASPDGGFLLGGFTVEDEYAQYWVIKIDGNGNKQWERFFNRGYDVLHNVTATRDGGFVLGGYSESFYYNRLSEDYWLIKIDGLGNKEWEKTLGGSDTDILYDLVTTPDGGYLASGSSKSDQSVDKSVDSRGGYDFWVVKLAPVPALTLRINAGGGAYTDARGNAYSADGYARGGSLTTPVAGEIARTEDDALYRQARYGERFTYSLPTGNGTYYVVLHFAETYWGHQAAGGAGSRQFHVDVEEARKLTDYDIFARAGGSLRAVQEAFRTEVRDGVLDIRFSRGAADFPLVAAIEVFPQENFKINVAGPAHFSATQGWYLSDFYGAGGAISQYAPGEVPGTEDDELYRSNRHGSLFHYNLPTGPGTFRVTLLFNETYWGNLVPGGAGSRRFNVNAEGEKRLTGYDTYQQSGGAMRAVREEFTVTVTDQILSLAFLTGRADGSVDFAHVAAIEVVRLPPAATARLAGEAAAPFASPAIRLHPNPAEATLTVGLPFPAGQVEATTIRDATGRTLLTNAHRKSGEKALQVDVSSLKPGLYLLQLQSGQGGWVLRFVKQAPGPGK